VSVIRCRYCMSRAGGTAMEAGKPGCGIRDAGCGIGDAAGDS
jgi:hypothetical protein